MTPETKTPTTEKLNFDIAINATPAKIWQALWNDTTYRQWTSVFSPGSHAVTDWKEGSKVRFLGDKGDGMYGIIAEHKPNERITFRHLGEVKDNKEEPESPWSGALESYWLKEENGKVRLYTSMDSTQDFKDYFTETIPKALAVVKEIAEHPIEITVETTVNVPVETAWKVWTTPADIMQWNNASDDWHTPHAENDLRVGGRFLSRMAARDGSVEFDFVGTYDEVKPNELIAYTMSDGRRARIHFTPAGSSTRVVETFDAESENTLELQQGGWQAILDNFKKYAESK